MISYQEWFDNLSPEDETEPSNQKEYDIDKYEDEDDCSSSSTHSTEKN